MNNEKLILETLSKMIKFERDGVLQDLWDQMIKIDEALAPKEDIPYEDSLEEGCGEQASFLFRCGEIDDMGKRVLCNKCQDSFAKSSSEVKK